MREDFRRFISPSEIQREMLCYSDGMGFESSPEFHILRTSFHNYLIMHTIAGRLWCVQNGEKIAVDPGETILLDLHLPHEYYFEKDHPSRIAWMHLNGYPVVQILQYFEQHSLLPMKMSDAEIYPQLLSIFTISDRLNPDVFEQSERCYALLLHILKKSVQETEFSAETSRQKEFKKNVWHMISHNLNRDVAIDELARGVSLSKYHFIRVFRQTFGLSPMQFILKEKIRQAKYELAYTNKTIAAIAESLDFATPSYFAKVFKRHTGYSPLNYRKYGYLHDTQING